MKKIIVTGGTGYLGSRLIKRFNGNSILCIVNNSCELGFIKQEVENNSISIISTSDNNFEKTIKAFYPDTIFHCAAKYETATTSITDLAQANYDFPVRLLEIVAQLETPVHWINTSTALDPMINMYALTKHQFSDVGKLFALRNKISFTNVLLEQFYGKDDNGSKFIPYLISKMKTDQPIPLTDGMQKRDFIYIDDVIDAYMLLSEHKPKGFSEYSLGTGEATRVKDIVEYLKKLLNSKSDLQFGIVPKRINEPECLVADISLLRKIGFSPKYNWKTGLDKIVEGII